MNESRLHDAHCVAAGIERLPFPQAALLADVTRYSLQFWGEHCTECAAPACFQTCDLFERAPSGRCRRFADGIVVRPEAEGSLPFTFEVLFKPWGQLQAVGNAFCHQADEYRQRATRVAQAGRISQSVQRLTGFLPDAWQWPVTDKMRGAGNRWPQRLNRLGARQVEGQPTEWRAVVGNPYPTPMVLEVKFAGYGDSQHGRVYRQTETLAPGWNVIRIPVEAIAAVVDLSALFRTCLVPLVQEPRLLQFAYAGFVVARAPGAGAAGQPQRKVKLLVVDLDHTLWDGILIEHPDGEFSLKPGIRDVLTTLDERGILLSVASRNNEADATRMLERLGILHLFLHPQISWAPKSVGIRRIVEQLNIGLDSAAFIDDTLFEREQVKAAIPEMRVYDALEFGTLPDLDEFDVPVTTESKTRRALYLAEGRRTASFEASSLDYEAFLRECQLQLELQMISEDRLERVYELVQRTNQLNFSGNRYTRADVNGFLESSANIPVVLSCEDRMGPYGIVGFALCRIDRDELVVPDMMYSCRIQAKRVEHAFLGWLLGVASDAGLARCRCHFNRTRRNNPASAVFAELGFQREVADGDHEEYVLACAQATPGDFPVAVVDAGHIAGRIIALATPAVVAADAVANPASPA